MVRAACAAVVLTAVMSGLVSGQSGPVPNAQAPEIVAAGRGDTTIAPTSAAFTVSVTTRAQTAAQAAAENAKRLASTLSWLHSQGLGSTDITTAGYSVGQHFEEERGRQVPAGFIARNTLRIEVRRLADLGKSSMQRSLAARQRFRVPSFSPPICPRAGALRSPKQDERRARMPKPSHVLLAVQSGG